MVLLSSGLAYEIRNDQLGSASSLSPSYHYKNLHYQSLQNQSLCTQIQSLPSPYNVTVKVLRPVAGHAIATRTHFDENPHHQ